MTNTSQNTPYNPESNIPIAQPTLNKGNTYAILEEEDEQVARNLHNNINSNYLNPPPSTEQQVIVIDNRPGASDAVVTGCLVGTFASLMCCTIQ